ncbi:molybdate transport system substrate-binding protein [Paenibacillus uliginis N3/975]|uniref:Molybdate transport system substrate-binding protein n=1 Tax=Paenibacillus uliginis N3/975 TaxID=1313296 RepID=A0A1X7HCL3_9BACL|nr:molybdate ABC transporter substrate-binding protein [Paenibacillus uliginis]SMF84066.1 molybdate transport system substrate-binding protein [Paenibacillus uliginis N3/975]
MFKFVKGYTLLSFVFVMMLVFTGCGAAQKTNSDTNTSTATPTESTPASSEQPVETVELTISAAASMTDALMEIQKTYESKNQNIKLNFNFGASGALQQQIEQGAPADLFLSAAVKNMTALVEKQLIDANQQANLLNNELVVVVPVDGKTPIENIADLTKPEVKNVAIGIPESVPAGNYAKEALTNAKLWDGLQAKSVQAKDVRQVLQYVETGNADAGFVYKTDALTSDKVKVAFAVDPNTYDTIQYPIGIIKATKNNKEAENFYTYLQSQEALDVFTKYGFKVPD